MKSQRRRIREPFLKFAKGGQHCARKLQIELMPCGEPHKAVTFELDMWQVYELVREAKQFGQEAVVELRQAANSIEGRLQLPKDIS